MRRDLLLAAMLIGMGGLDTGPRVLRCDPAIDKDTQRTLTAVCRRCGRRLDLDAVANPPACDGKRKDAP